MAVFKHTVVFGLEGKKGQVFLVEVASVKIPQAKLCFENKVKWSVTLHNALSGGLAGLAFPLSMQQINEQEKTTEKGHSPLKIGPPKPLALSCWWHWYAAGRCGWGACCPLMPNKRLHCPGFSTQLFPYCSYNVPRFTISGDLGWRYTSERVSVQLERTYSWSTAPMRKVACLGSVLSLSVGAAFTWAHGTTVLGISSKSPYIWTRTSRDWVDSISQSDVEVQEPVCSSMLGWPDSCKVLPCRSKGSHVMWK